MSWTVDPSCTVDDSGGEVEADNDLRAKCRSMSQDFWEPDSIESLTVWRDGIELQLSESETS